MICKANVWKVTFTHLQDRKEVFHQKIRYFSTNTAKLEAPHSKSKQLSTSKDAKETHLPTETHKDSSFGKVVSVQSQVKSSKREIMKAKADSALKNRMEEA